MSVKPLQTSLLERTPCDGLESRSAALQTDEMSDFIHQLRSRYLNYSISKTGIRNFPRRLGNLIFRESFQTGCNHRLVRLFFFLNFTV